MKYTTWVVALAITFVCLIPASSTHAQNLTGGANLAPNPGFEEVADDSTALNFGGRHTISSTGAHSGNFCIQQRYQPGNPWNAVASQVRIDAKPNQKYRFSVWCRNTVTAGNIAFGIRFDKTIDGELTGFTYSFADVATSISGWQQYTMTFTSPPETEAMAIYFLIGDSVSSGDIFWDDMTLEEVTQPLVSFEPLPATVFFKTGTKFVKNSYFDIKSNSFLSIDPAAISLTIDLGPGVAGYTLKTRLFRTYSNATVWRKTHSVQENETSVALPLGINKLGLGIYTVKTDLVDKNGSIVGTASKKISLLADRSWFPVAAPVQTIGIGSDNTIFVNGKPVFPVFVSHPNLNADFLRNMQTNFGLNFSEVWCPESDADACIADIRKKLDLCLAEKYYCSAVLFHAWAYDDGSKTWRYDALEKAVRALKDHPALLSWDLMDEPDGNEVPSAEVGKAYAFVKSIDAGHPIWVNFSFKEKFGEYIPYSDFASYDSYYYPMRPLLSIDDWNHAILESCGNGKPLVSYLQAFNWPGFDPPPPEQLKAEAFLSLTRGMRVFGYYSWQEYDQVTKSLNRNPELQSAVKEINYQLAALTDFLQAPAGVQPSIEALNNIPELRYIYKIAGAKRYLIVVNAGANSHNYAMELPGYRGVTVKALFEDGRPVSMTNGILSDSVKGYEVHVYAY